MAEGRFPEKTANLGRLGHPVGGKGLPGRHARPDELRCACKFCTPTRWGLTPDGTVCIWMIRGKSSLPPCQNRERLGKVLGEFKTIAGKGLRLAADYFASFSRLWE